MIGFENLGFDNNLLPAVRREIKHQDGEEGDAHAGDDQVDCVEQRLPPHCDVEGDVQVGLVAARVELDIPLSWYLSITRSRLDRIVRS